MGMKPSHFQHLHGMVSRWCLHWVISLSFLFDIFPYHKKHLGKLAAGMFLGGLSRVVPLKFGNFPSIIWETSISLFFPLLYLKQLNKLKQLITKMFQNYFPVVRANHWIRLASPKYLFLCYWWFIGCGVTCSMWSVYRRLHKVTMRVVCITWQFVL